MNGLELKCERIRAKIPQYRLAAKLGITQTELSEYENEKKLIPRGLEVRIRQIIENMITTASYKLKQGQNKKDSAESLAAPAESANQSINGGDPTHGN